MDKEYLNKLTDEELLIEKKKLKNSKIFHASLIGFLGGIMIFGFISWILSSEKNIGFFIPMIFPIIFIYRLIKNPKTNANLEEVLKERLLD